MKQALFWLVLFLPLAVFADTLPPDINTFLDPQPVDHHGINDTLYQMLTDAGNTIGFRGGKAQRSYEIKQAIQARQGELDNLYNFTPLISRQGVLPPVIVEANDLASITTAQIRTANKAYKILVPERFISNPPTWRQYLFAGLITVADTPGNDVIPKNSAQRAIWQSAIKSGWQQGRENADETLTANINRLTRDYTGMIRYSTLLQQHMITTPRVIEEQQTVTGNGQEILLGDKVRRLKERSRFHLDKGQYRPVIQIQ